jgi:hypothetical protein
MSDHDTDWLDRLAPAVYFATFLFIVLPAIDFVANVWPLRVGDASWRYGAAGFLSGYLLTPLLGLVLGFLVAALCRHRRALTVLSVVCGIGTVLLLVISLEFILDALQVRSGIAAADKGHFDVGAVKALLKYWAMVVALLWAGIVGWRIARDERRARGPRRSGSTPLVRSKHTKEG